MKNGPIPLAVHAMSEPLLAILFIVSPFLLGFSDDSAPTAVAIAAGVLVLLVGLTTNWRLAVKRIIPLPVHAMLDLGLGVVLVLSPFLFGFSDTSAPTIFFVLLGIGLVLASVGTRWTHEADVGGRGGQRPRRAKGRGGDAAPADQKAGLV